MLQINQMLKVELKIALLSPNAELRIPSYVRVGRV